MELFKDINLDATKSEFLYSQLAQQLKKMILEGKLKANSKLLPIRKFSNFLDVNNTTIVKAYRVLEEEGLVYKKIGSGTYVAAIFSDESNGMKAYLDYSSDMINFGSGTPSEALFPVDSFKLSINSVLEKYKGSAFGYTQAKGDESLIESIKNRLIDYPIDFEKNSIQIISGAQQGIDIISKALLSFRDVVLLESPTYTGAIAIFESRGCRFEEISIDYKGIDFDKLENVIKENNPKLFFAMPNLHNPTGYTYTLEEKKKVLELAEKYDFYIVEDDYASELIFDDSEIITLKKLDANNRVIYIKSFSKIFLPGLRLGYLIAPKDLEEKIIQAKHTTDISTSSLIQKSFDYFLKNELWDKHYDTMYKIFKEKYLISKKVFEKYLPEAIKIVLPIGGVNFWLKCKFTKKNDELYDYLLKNKILVAPGNVFYRNDLKKEDNYLRISIASIKKDELEDALIQLCNLLADYYSKEKSIKSLPIL